MSGWHADPANPGWYLWEQSDPAQAQNWTQKVASEPPAGFAPDPKNPGWYTNGGDPEALTSWWSDETVVPPPPPALPAYWTAAEIATASQCPLANVTANWPVLLAALVADKVASPLSCIGAIGTTAIESASTFAPVREAYWLSPAEQLAWYADTTQHAPYSGGVKYHGRGLIQTTHDYNYQAAQDGMKARGIAVDLMTTPDHLLDITYAAPAFVIYWVGRDLKTPSERQDWLAVRQGVYGGYDPDGAARIGRICDELLPKTRT